MKPPTDNIACCPVCKAILGHHSAYPASYFCRECYAIFTWQNKKDKPTSKLVSRRTPETCTCFGCKSNRQKDD
jgi:hypothetical protein